MPICQTCGTTNRDGAQFCYKCAARITNSRPSSEDHAWLAATLASGSASPSEADTQPLGRAVGPHATDTPPTEDEGAPMDQPQPPENVPPPAMFADRYEIVAQQGDNVEALDRQPWKHCWACGATSN